MTFRARPGRDCWHEADTGDVPWPTSWSMERALEEAWEAGQLKLKT